MVRTKLPRAALEIARSAEAIFSKRVVTPWGWGDFIGTPLDGVALRLVPGLIGARLPFQALSGPDRRDLAAT